MDDSLAGSAVHGIFQARIYWSGLPFPSPGDLPNPGMEPRSPALQTDALLSEPLGKPRTRGSKHQRSLQEIIRRQTIETAGKGCEVKVAQSCPTLCDPMDCKFTRLLCPWDSPGKSTGVGSHSLLQGIFSTRGLNPGLSHCQQILYHLSQQNPL